MAAKDKSNDAVEKAAQKASDVETDQGFRGTKVDPTPNENYTAAGVVAGKPTPETDEKQAEKAHAASVDLGKQ